MSTYTYKCRAECPRDVEELVAWFKKDNRSFNVISSEIHPIFYEFDLEFSSISDYTEILDKFKQADEDIGDLHVMYQTVNYSDKYTGERDYDL